MEVINSIIGDYKECLINAIEKINENVVKEICDSIRYTVSSGKHIYIFGNGGSSSTASHFTGDLVKSCKCKAFCLNDNTPVITAISNDCDYNDVFKMQLENLVEEEDLVIAISCSGSSLNVVNAVAYAKLQGIKTIGLSAFNGGALKRIADICLVVDTMDMEQAEDLHLMVCHIIKQLLELDISSAV